MKICIAGKNEIAVRGMKLIIKYFGKDNVIVCPNSTDDGKSNWQPSLVHHAKELEVEVVKIDECYDKKNLVFISLEYDKIINPKKFSSKKLFNIHFSKLPSYKGVYTSAWPIINGENESGVTLHCIDAGIDTGEIIDQVSFPLEEYETARSLYFKYMDYGFSLLNKNIKSLVSNEFNRLAQSSVNSTYYGLNSIDYKNIDINVNKTANQIGNQIRGFSFREYQLPKLKDFFITDFIITKDRSTLKPGALIDLDDNTFVLSTIDFDMIIKKDYSHDLFEAIKILDYHAVSNALDNGCNPNITNKQGWSPLMIAAYSGNLELCRILIAKGSEINLSNKNGTTPLMYAKDACEHIDCFKLCDFLIKSGANPIMQDIFGKTILHYAKIKGQTRAIEYFHKFYEH